VSTDAQDSLQLGQFDHVLATTGTALLRVAALAPEESDAHAQLTLVIDDGSEVHRIAQLPGSPGHAGKLRAAFAVPATLVADENKFALALDGDGTIDLPTPTRGRGRAVRTGKETKRRQSHPEGEKRAQPVPRVDSYAKLAQLAEQLAAARDALGGQENARRQAEDRLAAQIDTTAQAVRERRTAVRERDALTARFNGLISEIATLAVARADAEAAVVELHAERLLADQRRDTAAARAKALSDELEDVRGERDVALQRIQELEADSDQLRTRADDLATRLAGSSAHAREASDVAHEIALAREELERLRAELEETSVHSEVPQVALRARLAELRRERAAGLEADGQPAARREPRAK
jgi:uncharacterized coiled-coil DUF342 family protein